MEKIVVYLAGKVSANSSFGTSFWRDQVCSDMARHLWIHVVNLDPTQESIHENESEYVVWRDIYMIKQADIVVWFLTDDISIWWSQELLIAKYLWKPVLWFCERWGKFFQDKELYGNEYKSRIHPFVAFSCDALVHTYDEIPSAMMSLLNSNIPVKTITCIDECVQHYEEVYLADDKYIHDQLQ